MNKHEGPDNEVGEYSTQGHPPLWEVRSIRGTRGLQSEAGAFYFLTPYGRHRRAMGRIHDAFRSITKAATPLA